jgi:hypothetical protein
MHETALLNPFNTEQFIWIDAGYYRRPNSAPLNGPIVRNNFTAHGVRKDQVVFQQVQPSPTYEIAGGAWGGTLQAIQTVYDRYFETFWYLATKKMDCIGFEQRTMVWMCKSFPDICNLHQSRDWFAMGRNWLREQNHDFSNSTRIPHNVTKEGPLVTRVPFPTEAVIRSSSSPV